MGGLLFCVFRAIGNRVVPESLRVNVYYNIDCAFNT